MIRVIKKGSNKMKYFFILLILSALATIDSFSAMAEKTDQIRSINSWRTVRSEMACIDDEIFVLGSNSSIITNVYAISSQTIENKVKSKQIIAIKECETCLVLFREDFNLLDKLLKVSGPIVVEILNLQTNKTEEWARYSYESSGIRYCFCEKGNLYAVIHEDDCNYLALYTAPYRYKKLTMSENREFIGRDYPSFFLVDYREINTVSSKSYCLTILDYNTKKVYQSAENLNLKLINHYSYVNFQAVYIYPCFYYLSDSSIRCWNVENQIDEEIISFEKNRYERFTWLDNRVLLYDSANNADCFQINTKQIISSYKLNIYPNNIIVDENDLLYSFYLHKGEIISLADGRVLQSFELE